MFDPLSVEEKSTVDSIFAMDRKGTFCEIRGVKFEAKYLHLFRNGKWLNDEVRFLKLPFRNP